MKDLKTDAGSALSRFAKDKRLRQVHTERIERSPRGEDDHRSFNDRPHREESRHTYGEKSSGGRNYGEKPFGGKSHRSDDKPFGKRSYGADKPFGDKPFGKHASNHKPFGGNHPTEGGRSFGEKREERSSYNPNFTDDNRPKNRFGGKPFGEKSSGGRNYGEKSFGGKSHRSDDKPFGKRSYGADKPFGDKPFGKRSYGADKPFGKRSFEGGEEAEKPKRYPKYNPNKISDEIRLNRFVAQSGLCSRREADDYITAGLVSVNGVVVTQLGTKIKPTDEVRFNDERIHGEKNVYLLLNKPKGYVTTLEDEHASKVVMDLVKDACKERIYPVGRLDKNSLGLLLFTNDGDITRQLTHPSGNKKKIYEVALDKPLTRADFDRLAEGVTLDDGEAFFDEISYLKDDKKSVGVEIHSGRNRIVRRMFEHLGYAVTKLDRVYYAGLTKKNLKRGAWRFLTDDEVNRLKSGRYE